MKRTILAEIKEVSESDLKVMTVQEIIDFYNELVSGCTEEANGIDSHNENPSPRIEKVPLNDLPAERCEAGSKGA